MTVATKPKAAAKPKPKGADVGQPEPEDAAERRHLVSLTVKQLQAVYLANAYDGMPDLPTKPTKAWLVDNIMAGPELPAYPEGIPAFNPDTAPMTAEQLAAEAAGNAEADDAARAAHGDTSEAYDQLSLAGLGERPTKAVINVPALRLELSNRQFNDGDVVKVTGYVKVDTLKFFPEKVGKQGTRKVRAHSGAWVKPRERVTLEVVDD